MSYLRNSGAHMQFAGVSCHVAYFVTQALRGKFKTHLLPEEQ